MRPGYRWLVLAIGVLAQSALASFHQGLPSIGPALEHFFGVSLVQTGALFSAVALGIAGSLAAWGILADRLGERAVLTAGLLGAAAALATAAVAGGYGATFVALVAAGLLGACANAASGRAVMAWFAAKERGLALGIRQMATPLGGGLAALALPFAAACWGVPAAFWVLSAFCALAATACGLGLRRAPVDRKAAAGAGRSPLLDRRLWRLATGGSLIVAGQLSLVSYLVLFLSEERHWALAAAAAILTASQFLGAGARVGAGVWSDRLGERIWPMRWLALAGAALLAMCAVLVQAPLVVLVPILLLTTVVNMSTNGLAFTATGELAGVQRAGAAMGFQNTFLFVSGTIAPIAFGAAVTGLGWRFGFALLAAAGLAGWFLLAPLTRVERAGWREAVA